MITITYDEEVSQKTIETLNDMGGRIDKDLNITDILYIYSERITKLECKIDGVEYKAQPKKVAFRVSNR